MILREHALNELTLICAGMPPTSSGALLAVVQPVWLTIPTSMTGEWTDTRGMTRQHHATLSAVTVTRRLGVTGMTDGWLRQEHPSTTGEIVM